MAKVEMKGRDFIRCAAFWQPEHEGESFTGVLLDVNENIEDSLSGQPRPLYIFAALCPKGEKSTLILQKEEVKIRPGQIVGVNSTAELQSKLGDNVALAYGHEITIRYDKKESFKNKEGAMRSIKRFTVMRDTELHSGSHERDGKIVKYSAYARPSAPPVGKSQATGSDKEPLPFET